MAQPCLHSPLVVSRALAWIDAGVSIVPALLDGTKKPLVSWKPYQTSIASRHQVRRWYYLPRGILAIAGVVSGGLEIIDLIR